MLKLIRSSLGLVFVLSSLFVAQNAFAASSWVGFQTFSNCGGDNNSGACDGTPENNSTYDATPVGGASGNHYLTAVLGQNASAAGRDGRGQNTTPTILNGPGFGNETGNPDHLIENILMADGTPGTRIGPNGSGTQGAPNGTSTWKFSTNNEQRTGDIRLTNHSDYFFRLTFIHFDARMGGVASPHNLEIKYISGDGTAFDNELRRFDNNNELVNLNNVYNNDFGEGQGTHNVSRSLGLATGTQVYLAPGTSAGFRFVWTLQNTNGGETQMDNIAFEGNFFETVALANEIDPTAVVIPEPSTALLLGLGLLGVAARRRS